MSILKFSDGIKINTDGPLRIIHLFDGFYVTGHGELIPCKDKAEAEAIIREEQNEMSQL